MSFALPHTQRACKHTSSIIQQGCVSVCEKCVHLHVCVVLCILLRILLANISRVSRAMHCLPGNWRLFSSQWISWKISLNLPPNQMNKSIHGHFLCFVHTFFILLHYNILHYKSCHFILFFSNNKYTSNMVQYNDY